MTKKIEKKSFVDILIFINFTKVFSLDERLNLQSIWNLVSLTCMRPHSDGTIIVEGIEGVVARTDRHGDDGTVHCNHCVNDGTLRMCASTIES